MKHPLIFHVVKRIASAKVPYSHNNSRAILRYCHRHILRGIFGKVYACWIASNARPVRYSSICNCAFARFVPAKSIVPPLFHSNVWMPTFYTLLPFERVTLSPRAVANLYGRSYLSSLTFLNSVRSTWLHIQAWELLRESTQRGLYPP